MSNVVWFHKIDRAPYACSNWFHPLWPRCGTTVINNNHHFASSVIWSQNIDWLVQERSNSSALAIGFRLYCTNAHIWSHGIRLESNSTYCYYKHCYRMACYSVFYGICKWTAKLYWVGWDIPHGHKQPEAMPLKNILRTFDKLMANGSTALVHHEYSGVFFS